MVNSSSLPTIVTDTWVKASWEEFLNLAEDGKYADGRFYYDQGWMRIEISPLGPAHGRNNSVVSTIVVLFASLNNIRIVEFTNCSFRKTGLSECQPDIAFYIGKSFPLPPQNNSPVDLNKLEPPTLVVEISASSLSDDLGEKRLLYERLGVQEYWVVNVQEQKVIAFSIAEGRSGEIRESLVLPGLFISVVEEALQRSQTEDDGAITRWLLAKFS